MEALDGNAIAGPLFEYFGSEMTTVPGTCAFCGMTSRFGELRVYIKAPGAVARCPGCGNVVAVIVSAHGTLRVDVSAYKLTELSV
jgi:uncharacterized Zn finger protein